MTPSFDLFEKGGLWFARTKLPSGTLVDVALDTKHKEAAKDIAKVRVMQKWRASMAGIAAGKHLRARKAAVAEGLKAAAPAPPPEPDPRPPAPPPEPEPAPPAAAPIPPERSAEIAGKLRALGDGQPLDDEGQVDKVYAPGEREKEKADEEEAADEVDDETGELLADLIATAIVAGTVKGVAVRLAKRKPPERPGEPHEKMLEWYHFGARENLRKLIGKAGTLGPTAKLFIGGTGVVVSMVWGAEIIDEASRPREAPRQAAPAARSPDVEEPAPAAASSAPNGANGVARPAAAGGDTPAPAPDAGALALGRFH